MNDDVSPDHVSLHYYDSDYPSNEFGKYPENFDATTELQGLMHDVPKYRELAKRLPGPVLELCCGTGRVSIPLAKDGHRVTGLDISKAYLARFAENLATQTARTQQNVTLVKADAASFQLAENFGLIIMAFNSLNCIPDLERQRLALRRASEHLLPEGRLVIDAINPHVIPADGDQTPKPFFTRRNVHTGCWYTRFAMSSPWDADQRQHLYGWYDEERDDGSIQRRRYDVLWRPVHRFELQLMLEEAGLRVESLESGHRGEPYVPGGRKLFVVARHA